MKKLVLLTKETTIIRHLFHLQYCFAKNLTHKHEI